MGCLMFWNKHFNGYYLRYAKWEYEKPVDGFGRIEFDLFLGFELYIEWLSCRDRVENVENAFFGYLM